MNITIPFCSSEELIMRNDHCYWKNILLLAPSDNSGTFSQEETFCFIPFIFFCLLITNCRRKGVGKNPFLEQRTFPTICYNFLRWCIVTNGIKPCHLLPWNCCMPVLWWCWCVLLSKSCPASICSHVMFHLSFTGTAHLPWTNLLCLDATDCQ